MAVIWVNLQSHFEDTMKQVLQNSTVDQKQHRVYRYDANSLNIWALVQKQQQKKFEIAITFFVCLGLKYADKSYGRYRKGYQIFLYKSLIFI